MRRLRWNYNGCYLQMDLNHCGDRLNEVVSLKKNTPQKRVVSGGFDLMERMVIYIYIRDCKMDICIYMYLYIYIISLSIYIYMFLYMPMKTLECMVYFTYIFTFLTSTVNVGEYSIHPRRLTWNLRVHSWKRKIIFQTPEIQHRYQK